MRSEALWLHEKDRQVREGKLTGEFGGACGKREKDIALSWCSKGLKWSNQRNKKKMSREKKPCEKRPIS